MKMRWKADLPKMPRLPKVPLESPEFPSDTPSVHAPGAGAWVPLGPPPAPSAYREKNPYESAPAEYKAPSMLAEHKGLALLFIAAVIAFALYCWKAPQRSVALDAAAPAAHGATQSVAAPAAAAGNGDPRGETARTRTPESSQSPIYVETLPDK